MFKSESEFDSDFSISEVTDLLERVTEKFYTNTSNEFMFEGKISLEKFEIYPTFDFGPNHQLRPIIIGKLKTDSERTEINLKFQLPSVFRALLLSSLILSCSLMIVMFAMPGLVDSPLWGFWWLPPVFISFTYLLFYIDFAFKVNKSIKILTTLLRLRKASNSE